MLYEEAVNYIFGLRKFGSAPGVLREEELLKRLGNPEKNLNIIHVAGTNGKGSVCSYIESILRKLGYKTGLFTSPHLVRVNERIRINNICVDNKIFMQAFNRVYETSRKMIKDGLDGAAFFDYIMAMAMLIFDEENVDYVIMETGLGGRTDCTNAVKCPLMSVITSISLDHTEILGDTVDKIACEKAGIIKRGVPVVFWSSMEETDNIIMEQAYKMNAPFRKVSMKDCSVVKRNLKHIDFFLNNSYYKNNLFSINTTALYQVSNCAVALCAISVLDSDRGFDEDNIHAAVRASKWEGRMEEAGEGFYIDGAHNEDGIRAFLQTAEVMPASHKYLLFSAVCEKDYDRMIRNICESSIFDGYIVTELNSSRALKIDVIENEFRKYTDRFVIVKPCVSEALESALDMISDGSILFAAGSLYLVGEIKSLLSS